ncbi:MAG: AIR synthase-related protein, partial [Mycobacteriales bacterium]
AQTLAESCLASGNGAAVALPAGQDAFVQLFSESTARTMVCVSQANLAELVRRCEEVGVPAAKLGVVTELGGLEILDGFSIESDELRQAYTTVPAALI